MQGMGEQALSEITLSPEHKSQNEKTKCSMDRSYDCSNVVRSNENAVVMAASNVLGTEGKPKQV